MAQQTLNRCIISLMARINLNLNNWLITFNSNVIFHPGNTSDDIFVWPPNEITLTRGLLFVIMQSLHN